MPVCMDQYIEVGSLMVYFKGEIYAFYITVVRTEDHILTCESEEPQYKHLMASYQL